MRLYAVLILLICPLAVLAAPTSKPVVIENTMTRAEFEAVHRKGPQRFIATVRVDPVMKKGRFVGYRLVGVSADSPMASSQNIRPGDIVVSVNKESLERPEQFMRAWDVIRDAQSLDIMILRSNQRYLYRWKLIP